ncbi:PEP/pyruvate-binding domain-containing protein [Desulfogranum mediterraneum]|uniref:PEP/pyruvate-binding domain-containing protein n=1 Tax=Desulfogranum mediterraneum TaxID=160661 RepID=UPI000422F49D|nr:PEP/pyruvate-binding domain-containing protein [Desulfogranum mediterraneum]
MLLNALFKHWSYRIFAPGTMLREKYEALKRLLQYDIHCHEQMAEFQGLLHGGQPQDLAAIRKRFSCFSQEVSGMIAALETMAPGSYLSLKNYHKKFDSYIRFLLAPPRLNTSPPYVLPLEEVTVDTGRIGNKAKNLARIHNELGLSVPRGFVVTASGFHAFIEYNKLRTSLDELLAQLRIHSPRSLQEVSGQLQTLVRQAKLVPAIKEAMLSAYDGWRQDSPAPIRVAVRSSALGEDGRVSFAGQYTTLLDVERDRIAWAYQEVLASKYRPEALFYRISHGLGDEETAMSVLVQEMVQADCSGVLYTQSVLREPGHRHHLHIHATRGSGDRLVAGRALAENSLLTRDNPPRLVSGSAGERILPAALAIEIAEQGLQLKDLFGAPQDIEWAVDASGALFILQARPLQLAGQNESPPEDGDGPERQLLRRACEQAAPGSAAGRVYQLDESHPLEDIPQGAVLVSRDSPPDHVQVIHRVAAVLAERGSRASHFATVAREFGVPYLTKVTDACASFQPGSMITVDGNRGCVYAGPVESLLQENARAAQEVGYQRILKEALSFITPLELVDAAGDNFTPEGCRSMHDIIRFCHEKALLAMFTAGSPGSGRGALRLVADLPLDVYLFDVGGGISTQPHGARSIPLNQVASAPFQALWRGMDHPGVQWKQKPFDWEAYDKIALSGGVPPKRDSFAFASYAVIGADYLHFNLRFGYHFTIVDVLCADSPAENHCLLRFAGGGGDYEQRLLRIDFIARVLHRLEFVVEKKGDLLEAKLTNLPGSLMLDKLDMLGRLLGASKLMDMVLVDRQMVAAYVEEFYRGRYSFSQEG